MDKKSFKIHLSWIVGRDDPRYQSSNEEEPYYDGVLKNSTVIIKSADDLWNLLHKYYADLHNDSGINHGYGQYNENDKIYRYICYKLRSDRYNENFERDVII